jgi:hypothetical protein
MLGYTLVGTAISTGLVWFYATYFYIRILPGLPQPTTGNVIELDVHGTIVFMTESQSLTLWLLQLGVIIFGAVGGLLLKFGRNVPR